jgi:hypothetical protein
MAFQHAVALLLIASTALLQAPCGLAFKLHQDASVAAAVGTEYHYEVALRGYDMVSTPGSQTAFGCASINITLENPTLLANGTSFTFSIAIYMESKFPASGVSALKPTWAALQEGIYQKPETNVTLFNTSAVMTKTNTWKNSSYLMGVNGVQQSVSFKFSISDSSALSAEGFASVVVGTLARPVTLNDAVPYVVEQTIKHYVIIADEHFPSGSLRGQLIYSPATYICGV